MRLVSEWWGFVGGDMNSTNSEWNYRAGFEGKKEIPDLEGVMDVNLTPGMVFLFEECRRNGLASRFM